MRSLITVSAVTVLGAIGLAACHPPHPHDRGEPKPISRLDCPQSEGDLDLKSAAPDGKSCIYASHAGDSAMLELVSLDGRSAQDALAPIENRLRSELPPPSATPKPPATPGKTQDKVDIDLPGLHIHSSEDGRAQVDTAGVHVEAHDRDGDHGRATVRIGGEGAGVSVDANDGGAQVRVREKGAGFRATVILTSETPGPHGWRTAGYVARGPSAGPIVVASALTKADDMDEVHDDLKSLVRRNARSE